MIFASRRGWKIRTKIICGEKRARRVDYGAGGGSFIGVSVSEGVGDACGVADCNSTATGAVVVSGVGELRMDDIGDACDAVARRSLEKCISAIRATSIVTTTAATTADRVQSNILRSRPTDSV
jgi:hypothetical protein